MIILIGGEKGGTGKTTLATNLAALLKYKGSDVLLVDTDKQGSASYWATLREAEPTITSIPTVQKFSASVYSAIQDLCKRYDDVIIDAGGRDSVELRSALSIADKVFIPLQASQFDVWTLGAMDKLVEQAQGINHRLKASVVINRAPTNPSVNEVKEAQSILEDLRYIALSEVVIRDRIAYRKAARSGFGVFEMATPDSKAVDEMYNFYEEVVNEYKNQAA